MIGRFLSRMRNPARRLKRRFVPTGVILMYHRVAEVRHDPWGLAVSPAHFDQQLEVMRRCNIRLMTVAELARSLAAGSLPGRSAAISFDDGYLDNLTAGRPLLERHGARGTVFVTAGEVGLSAGFWWDQLADVLLGRPSLPHALHVAGRNWPVPTSAAGRGRLYREVWQAISDQPVDRHRLVADVARWAGAPADAEAPARIMNEEELLRLADGGLVEIASHGWTHSRLGDLPEPAQRDELTRSRRRLEEIVGAPVIGFSYPHGSRSARSSALAKECGYAYACGSRMATARRSADPFDLPRIMVEDWGAEPFERFLRDTLLS